MREILYELTENIAPRNLCIMKQMLGIDKKDIFPIKQIFTSTLYDNWLFWKLWTTVVESS